MRSTNFIPIDTPIKLHLEFSEITLGEISNLLRQWQAILRTAWRESYEIQYAGEVPTARILAVAVSTENSLDVLSDIAIPALYFSAAFLGPVRDWPAVARAAYAYLGSVWLQIDDEEDSEYGHNITIRGGDVPELDVPAVALKDSETGERIVRLWRIANSGDIDIDIEEPD